MAEKARKAGAVEADESKTASFISRIRPTHRRALEIGVLGAVLIIAALFRIMPLKWGTYYTAYDPFLMYRASEYVAKNGYAAWWSWHDTLSWYPMGRDIPHTVYAGSPSPSSSSTSWRTQSASESRSMTRASGFPSSWRASPA
jgi:hypothetical protein